MKLLFVGAVNSSAHALRKLINVHENIVGVCALSHTSFNSDHCNLALISSEVEIPGRILVAFFYRKVYLKRVF